MIIKKENSTVLKKENSRIVNKENIIPDIITDLK